MKQKNHVKNEEKVKRILSNKNLTDAQKRKKALQFLEKEGY